MKKRVKISKDTKFCPNCGAVLKAQDAYCLRCGYNFIERTKKNRKISWKKIIIILLIFALIYIFLRKFVLHKPILPDLSALFKFNKTG